MSQNQQVAVVTGAGSGMGRASSLKLAEMGMKVVIVDFNQQTGEETLALIQDQGGEGIIVQADVTKSADVQKYVNTAVETYDRIDVFFNNASSSGLRSEHSVGVYSASKHAVVGITKSAAMYQKFNGLEWVVWLTRKKSQM